MITQASSLESYGLGTADARYCSVPSNIATVPDAPDTDYLNYWTGPYMNALCELNLLDDAEYSKLHKFSLFLRGLTQGVIREGLRTDDDFIDNIPYSSSFLWQQDGHRVRSPLYRAIDSWDRGLGSLNLLASAQADHLRAAHLLIAENLYPGLVEAVPASGDESAYNSIISFWEENDSFEHPLPSRQRSPASIILAAQFIQRAAIIETADDRKTVLLGMALQLYDHLAENLPSHRVHAYMANEYSRDVRIQTALNTLRSTGEGIGSEAGEEAVDELRSIAFAIAEDLYRQYRFKNVYQGKAGVVFEKFVKLIVLDHIIDTLGIEEATSLGLRGAFQHEDKSASVGNLDLSPISRFDMVISSHCKNGTVRIVPVQLKLNGGIKQGSDDQAYKYFPHILVPQMQLRQDRAMATTRRIMRKYCGLDYSSDCSVQNDILQKLGLIDA